MSHSYNAGRAAARAKFATVKNPLIQGHKVETGAATEAPMPKPKVWTPPPNATSGTVLNPKVASRS